MPTCLRYVSSAILLFLVGIPSAFGQSTEHAAGQPSPSSHQTPTPADLLKYADPQRLSLSPDGRFALLETRQADVENNRYESSRVLLPTGPSEPPQSLDLPSRARSFAWGPGSNQFAYLAPADSNLQVWVKEIGDSTAQQLTEAEANVRSFKFSSSGDQLAYTIRKPVDTEEPESDSLRGEEIDLGTFTMWDLEELPSSSSNLSQTELWIKDLETERKAKVSGDLSVDEYSWSPSGERVAITAAPTEQHQNQAPGLYLQRSDLYLYVLGEERLQQIHQGHQDSTRVFEGVVSYSTPFWSPSGERLGFLRTDWSARFARTPELGVYNTDKESTRYVTSDVSQDLDAPRFHWISPDSLFVEYTHHAERGLYHLSLGDGTTSPVWAPGEREAKGFSFSEDWTQAVWVQESAGNPPEIYTARRPFESPQQISSLNEHMEDLWLPDAESVTWISTDGTEVQGWLLRPEGHAESDPPPLLTLVHGGPSATVRNEFHVYDSWPFPVQVFAARGYAVFIPNYRHTESFGKEFQKVSALDQEPVQDILTGIDHLAAEQLADTTRMGIMGHSHGGWLGPLVAAERPDFDAASFAEGIRANFISTYGRGAGWLARDLTQYLFDATPYENLDRSAELSPALRNQFTKTTPTHLEYGQESGTVNGGIELGRAFWHHETPHALVVYPGVGHNIREPAVAIESMNRNLDWFERWIPADAPQPEEVSRPMNDPYRRP